MTNENTELHGKLKKIADDLNNSEVILKGDYKYILLPGDFQVLPDEIDIFTNVLAEQITESINPAKIDKIVTIETKGILFSLNVAKLLNKPLIILRKRAYDLPGEVELVKSTAYKTSKIYINGLNKGDRIIIVDDLISTGGTLEKVIETFISMELDIMGVFVVFDKPEYGGKDKILKKFDINIQSLIEFNIDNNNKVKSRNVYP